MSGLYKHTKLMEAESVAFNENKLIQGWVDVEIKYPYTPLDLGNRKYKQTIARTGFTEDINSTIDEKGIYSYLGGQTHKTDKTQVWF